MRSVKLEEGEGESSRCSDQVFGSRVTTSTLAGEYVTARDCVGERASCEISRRVHLVQDAGRGRSYEGEVYVLLKQGAADYGEEGSL